MRQVNRCLKLAVDVEVRGIRIALQRGSGAEAADALDRKSPLALQRKYPKLRQVRDGWIKCAEYYNSCCRGDVMSLRILTLLRRRLFCMDMGWALSPCSCVKPITGRA